MPHRAALIASLAPLLLCIGAGAALAGNVDPAGDGSRYAYGENVGWIDAAPGGVGGSGVLVADFELTGWMWAENAGWISLSCKNTGDCAAARWGVRNNGSGVLTGYAWSENAGWIDFGPSASGVTVDPATGLFAGRAWGENVGWVSFASSGPYPFHMTTAWRCSPAPPAPAGSPTLSLQKDDDAAVLLWSGPAAATGFDVVRGDLGTLRSTGSFSPATESCLADDTTLLTLRDGADLPPGAGRWYLVRGVNCGGGGTYDSGAGSQQGPRDPQIGASSNRCP